MHCAHCGRNPGDATPPCPQCPDARSGVSSLPAVPESDKDALRSTPVLEAEVVDEHDGRAGRHVFSQTTENGGTRFTFASWNIGGGSGGAGGISTGLSCLPGCITLFLLALCAVQFGVLAAVGFLFFYMIGSWIAIFAGLQRALQGRSVNPWIPRVINWCVCWLLVGWLSGGF